MIASIPMVQSNLLNSGSLKDTSSPNKRLHDSDDLPVVPTKLSLQMVDQHEPASSNKSKRGNFSSRANQSREHIVSDYDLSEKNDVNIPRFDLSKEIDEDHKFTNKPYQKSINDGENMTEYDLLDDKLYKFHTKTQSVLSNLTSCMHSFQINSSDKKVEMICKNWIGLNQQSQRVLRTQMKNQFNIDLSHFNMNPQDPDSQNKMNLKYVKTSIIESLYQEVDMLS
jgi:hypothetical protein